MNVRADLRSEEAQDSATPGKAGPRTEAHEPSAEAPTYPAQLLRPRVFARGTIRVGVEG